MRTNQITRISAAVLGFALLTAMTANPAFASHRRHHGHHGHHGGHHGGCHNYRW